MDWDWNFLSIIGVTVLVIICGALLAESHPDRKIRAKRRSIELPPAAIEP